MDGVINLNKSAGISSARAVAAVKKITPRGTKVGHAGTLDPFATGILLILVGRATKLCEKLMSSPKGYLATIKLGATTSTLDPESEESPLPVEEIPPEIIQSKLTGMIGLIRQRPPIFSALKISGQPAYKLARKGKEVQLAEREVRIDSLEMLSCNWPFVRVKIECGRGTYIRSIARDLGESLGTGGYLTELTRTHVGDFSLESAVSLEDLRSRGIEACLTQPAI